MRNGRWIAIGSVALLGTVLAYLAIDPPPPGRGGVTGVFRGIDDGQGHQNRRLCRP